MHETSQLDRLYIAVRADLPPGLQAAQAVHAAVEFSVSDPDAATRWHRDSNFLVVVSVSDELGVVDLIGRAKRAQVPFRAVREPDVGNEFTAVVLGPGAGARRLCSALPLALRGCREAVPA